MKKLNNLGKLSFKTNAEDIVEEKILKNLFSKNVPSNELLENLGLFLTSKNLSRLICLNDIYKKQIELNGNIFDFGTRWGQNAAIFAMLRSIYEPFNRHKRVFAFDTFSGFKQIHKNDGKSTLMKKGNLRTSKDYEEFLQGQLDSLDELNPLSYIKKNFVLKGDACIMLKDLLKKNPEIIVSLAYFDFDLYEPTKKCLELLKSRFVKGTIICFDEANDPDSPGETKAIMDTMGLNKIKLTRHSHASRVSYFIFD
jgi:hypothetical protein